MGINILTELSRICPAILDAAKALDDLVGEINAMLDELGIHLDEHEPTASPKSEVPGYIAISDESQYGTSHGQAVAEIQFPMTAEKVDQMDIAFGPNQKAANHRRRWTDDDDRRLSTFIDNDVCWQEAARILGRSRKSLFTRASKLGKLFPEQAQHAKRKVTR